MYKTYRPIGLQSPRQVRNGHRIPEVSLALWSGRAENTGQ